MTAQNTNESKFTIVASRERRSNLGLRLEKELDDHGAWRLGIAGLFMVLLAGTGGWLIGGSRQPSVRYSFEAAKLLFLDLFGGQLTLNTGVGVDSDLLIFEKPEYNAFDVAATNLHSLSTHLKEQGFEQILKKAGGRVRILVLDPRIALDARGKHSFEALSRQFGDTPEVTLAESLLSTVALSVIKRRLAAYGDRFQVRFYREPHPDAAQDHFLLGRTYQKYVIESPSKRFDIIIPYGNPQESGKDSSLRITWLIRNSPENERVKLYSRAFEQVWSTAVPIEEVAGTLPSLFEMKLKQPAESTK